jgi:hypothetical protein
MKRLFVVILGVGSTLFGLGSQAASLNFVHVGRAAATGDDYGVIGNTESAVGNPVFDGTTFSAPSGEGREIGFLDLVFNCEAMLCGPSNVRAAHDSFGAGWSNATGAWDGIDFSLLGVLTAGVLDRTQPGVDSALGDFSIVFGDLADAAVGSDSTVHTSIAALGTGDVSSVPLPPALWLFLTAILTLAGFNSRKRRGAQPLPSY